MEKTNKLSKRFYITSSVIRIVRCAFRDFSSSYNNCKKQALDELLRFLKQHISSIIDSSSSPPSSEPRPTTLNISLLPATPISLSMYVCSSLPCRIWLCFRMGSPSLSQSIGSVIDVMHDIEKGCPTSTDESPKYMI